MNRQQIKQIESEMIELLGPLAKKHGLTVKSRGGKFTTMNFIAKVEFAAVGDGGVVHDEYRENYTNNSVLFGLKKEWLDQTVVIGDGEFTIVGLNTRARSKPVLVKRIRDDKPFKVSTAAVTRALGDGPRLLNITEYKGN